MPPMRASPSRPACSTRRDRSSISIVTAVRKAIQAGVKIAMGTDSGVTPHGRNLRELELMAGLGMTPAAVLEATTRSAARLLGVDDRLGTIEPGKVADLVVVDGDAYAFDTLAERIDSVWLDGRRAVQVLSRGSPARPSRASPGLVAVRRPRVLPGSSASVRRPMRSSVAARP